MTGPSLMKRCILTSIFGAFCSFGFVPAQAPNDAAPLLSAWKTRSGWYETIRYRLSGTQIMTPILWANSEHNVKESVEKPDSAVVLFDIANKRMRIERQTHVSSGSGSVTMRYDHVYTLGKNGLKFFFDRTANTVDHDLGTTRPDLTLMNDDAAVFPPMELEPIFWAHGVVPTPQKRVLTSALFVKHDVDDFISGGVANFNQRPLQVYRTEAISSGAVAQFAELWVDLRQDGAVYKKTLYNGKRILSQIESTYKTANGRSLPSSWVFTLMLGAKIGKVYTFKVDSIEANPEVGDSDFDTPMTPGMLVSKDNTDAIYKVGSNGELNRLTPERDPNDPATALLIRKEQQVRESEGNLAREESTRGRWWWYLVGVVLLLASCICFARLRGRAK